MTSSILVASKIAEKYMTGRNEIVAVVYGDDRDVLVYSNKRSITRKNLPRELDGIKIKIKKVNKNVRDALNIRSK